MNFEWNTNEKHNHEWIPWVKRSEKNSSTGILVRAKEHKNNCLRECFGNYWFFSSQPTAAKTFFKFFCCIGIEREYSLKTQHPSKFSTLKLPSNRGYFNSFGYRHFKWPGPKYNKKDKFPYRSSRKKTRKLFSMNYVSGEEK